MPHWDVFHSERLEAERGLTTQAVRDLIARGNLNENDLVRPAGDSRWSRLGESPEFAPLIGAGPEAVVAAKPAPTARVEAKPEAPPPTSEEFEVIIDDDDDDEPGPDSILPDDQTQDSDLPELDPQDEDDEAAEFTLSRNAPETVEELDLAAMVDVAFQLVLFFLVTAQVVLFKTLEIPRPNEDKPPEAAAQGRSRSVDELEKDYILVEVDAAGAIKVDHQPVAANRAALVERLRSSREATARKAMLLSADFATRHENAVLVFDVANEIDLSIAIAQPTGKK